MQAGADILEQPARAERKPAWVRRSKMLCYPAVFCIQSCKREAMPHTIRNKKPLIARVRRIRGQAEALEKALGDEAECAGVLQQIAAIRGAVNGLMTEVLEGHLREHVAAKGTAEHRQQDLEAVVKVLRSYLK